MTATGRYGSREEMGIISFADLTTGLRPSILAVLGPGIKSKMKIRNRKKIKSKIQSKRKTFHDAWQRTW
jgi:hypothetical protein